MRYKIPPASSGSAPGVSFQSAVPIKLVPEQPQLGPLDTEEQWLYFQLQETYLSRVYPQCSSLSRYSKLITEGEGRNID